METRNHRQQQQNQPTSFPRSPLPTSSSSSPPPSYLLKDISNFKTPRNPPKIPNSPHSKFFTAQRATPFSASSRLRISGASARSKTARRLKAFEHEQSKSARRNQVTKEKSLKSLAKSLSVWLNFLFENPKSCGCDVSRFDGEFDHVDGGSVAAERECSAKKGKRESGPGRGVKVGVDGPWRGPKRQRDLKWKGGGSEDGDFMHLRLQASLREICSFDDLKERMRAYLSLESCKEIFDTMTQVTKV